jgi:hypothetical protein
MVLDESREKVLSWFEGRNYGSIQDMREVLSIRGYEVKDVRQVGCAGGVRRIVALTHKADNKGHAVVMDDDESIVDPKFPSPITRRRTLLDYSYCYPPQNVFVIRKRG